MARKPEDDDALENQRTWEKFQRSGIKEFDNSDWTELGGMAGNIIPGPVGRMVDLPASALAGEFQAQNEEEKYSKRYGNLDKKAVRSHAVRRKLDEWRTRWRGRMGEAAVAGTGAFAGGAALGALASGPAGWVLGMGGAAAGWMGGSMGYNKIFPNSDQNVFRLVSQIERARKNGEVIPEEAVASVLAANLPSHRLTKLEDRLEDSAGTRQFEAALGDPNGQETLSRMAQKDSPLDKAVRLSNGKYLGIREFTALINSGQMKPRELLDPNSFLVTRGASIPPALPDMPQLAAAPMPDVRPPQGLPPRPGQKGLV